MKSKRVTSNKCCTWRFITSNVRLTMLVIQSTFFVTTFRTLSIVSAAPYFWYHNEKLNCNQVLSRFIFLEDIQTNRGIKQKSGEYQPIKELLTVS